MARRRAAKAAANSAPAAPAVVHVEPESAEGRTRRERLNNWFKSRGWKVQPFQREVWAAWAAGKSGLLHAPTGSGKTLAVWGAALLAATLPKKKPAKDAPRLKILWITPLRALAADTEQNLRAPLDALGLQWTIGTRTGDSGTKQRDLARKGLVDALITTPESLALLLTYADTQPVLAGLEGIVVDEWHELLGNKRGVLLELCLARVKKIAPKLRIWGISATLGNLDEARDALIPDGSDAVLVRGTSPQKLALETLVPDNVVRFPWAGHLGMKQLPAVLARIYAANSTLLFTNVRSAAELWHQALSSVWLEDPSTLALHHGSLDRGLRREVEDGLRAGRLRCVIATSSLDLGVDFAAVDQVIQLGSPKSIARLLQRAGRSGHRPGERSRLINVPTHALELIEFAAARDALNAGRIEARHPLRLSLDVLAQHLVTLALGGGFEADDALAEIRTTHAFRDITPLQWQAVLDFIVRGGEALQHYPDYRRVEIADDGRYLLADRRVALRHRLSVGTIASDGSLRVKYMKGGDLGSIEEQFVGRMKPGDRFLFAGRALELVTLKDMTAYVRIAKGKGDAIVPRWQGSRMPLSTELAHGVQALIAGEHDAADDLAAVLPLLDLQARISHRPARDEFLVEVVKRRDGQHVFLYPFAGRQVHEGLAAMLAARLGKATANSFSFAINDYGLVLSPAKRIVVDEPLLRSILSADDLVDGIRAGLNLSELARRRFRDIARVAGLLPPSLPGRTPRSMRQLQASSGLLFDVLTQHDPGHLLLDQAFREVLDAELDIVHLRTTLDAIASRRLVLLQPDTLSPLSFPLWAEGFRGALSTEDWRTRVERAAAELEAKYG
ncbi:ligase-associated DNA damage response DEXH box helicase [Chiayiivirga flava]|nr:ligase-associated DNA damage response DEXH box helicase [Chiayiivirga flava]